MVIDKLKKRSTRAVLVMLTSVAVISMNSCGKKVESTQKTAEQANSEREASLEKAKQSVVFGDQLKAMDKARAMADEAAKVAAERMKKADQ